MPAPIRTHLVPQLADPNALAGGIVIVIDQLRASTTICAALHHGARRVVPFLEPEYARAFKTAQPDNTTLTGGEREGLLIPGFDLDNSPASYTRERVANQTIAFTTTNGTRAVALAEQADLLIIGCLANLSALAASIPPDDRPVHLLCAGTRTRVTLEDTIAAGAIAEQLSAGASARPTQLEDARPDDDSTLIALQLWRDACSRPDGILEALTLSRGGRNLAREGLARDIALCAQLDAYPVVPRFHKDRGFTL